MAPRSSRSTASRARCRMPLTGANPAWRTTSSAGIRPWSHARQARPAARAGSSGRPVAPRVLLLDELGEVLEAVEPPDRAGHAVVALERLAVPVEEPPVARAE